VRVLAIGSMFPPHHLGGYELIWASAMDLLHEQGHEPAVLATDFAVPDPEPRPEPGYPVRRELRWYLRGNRFPRLPMRERLVLERHNSRVLERALSEHRPDVVSWWAMGGMSLSLIERVRRAGIPSVAALCDDWFAYADEVDAWTRAFARRPRLGRAVERLTGVPTRPVPGEAIGAWVFLSAELLHRASVAGLEPRDRRVAHRGADPIFTEVAPDTRPWRWRLLYLGRIDERKGIDLAIEALAELPEAVLQVCGGGDEKHLADLRALAERLGVAGRTSFVRAPRPELPGIVAGADVVVFPVRWREPWGLVPLEAMAAGTPVVATGRGGSGEYLEHERNSLLFDPDEGAGALAAEIRRLAGDEDLRERLRAAGRETAARFDPRGFEREVARALAEIAAF
jgi:glycogen(starch) synthase